jgi:hypothetical protein
MVIVPLESIPGSFSLTSPRLGVECVVVEMGEYHYSHKTKYIEKRVVKRKRGGVNIDMVEMNIKYKAIPKPKESYIQTTSILNDFVGANSMSVYEMDEALDVAKLRITELENVIGRVKNSISNEFREKSVEIECIHREKMQRKIHL